MEVGGSTCALGSARTHGFAVFDATGALIVLTCSDDGEDVFTFVGVK